MKASDAALIEIARKAGVRPPHVFHLWHYRKAMGNAFSPEGFAAFAMLDLKHVIAILGVIGDQPQAKPRQARQRAVVAPLPADWVMPEDWLILGRERRFWTMDVCRTEAERFANYFKMKGTAYADWRAAWMGWIDRSHRENGKAGNEPTKLVTRDQIERSIAFWKSTGRPDLVEAYERQLAALNPTDP